MSLVAYGSSDESENEEENSEPLSTEINTQNVRNQNGKQLVFSAIPKIYEENIDRSVEGRNISDEYEQKLISSSDIGGKISDDDYDVDCEQKLDFNVIPEPKPTESDNKGFAETDSVPLPKKIDYGVLEKPTKKGKGPTKISIPSLSEFKDLEEENKRNPTKMMPSQKGSGLISMLPAPKTSISSSNSSRMVPDVLTRKPTESSKISMTAKTMDKSLSRKRVAATLTSLSNYTLDSEDEDDKNSSTGVDFFSLTKPTKIPDELLLPISNDDLNDIAALCITTKNSEKNEQPSHYVENKSNKTLVSNVMNLPREEILLKNKSEVGPKLPVPEQEYHLDTEGNVAFDEKAIEYLCGKRGVKRKNDFENVDIIEINGEDIKPDEREWLVKALTEEPVQRPISVGAGPSGQSKKKHQITYLAHQAKAMEIELKNQWAQNKATKQATRSKYGF